MSMEKPNRFTATPAEILDWLRSDEGGFAEDVVLRFQQAIGNRAVAEAAQDQRMQANHQSMAGDGLLTYLRLGWRDAANHIDPLKDGGHYPSQLLCGHHDGIGPCPGAMQCHPGKWEEGA